MSSQGFPPRAVQEQTAFEKGLCTLFSTLMQAEDPHAKRRVQLLILRAFRRTSDMVFTVDASLCWDLSAHRRSMLALKISEFIMFVCMLAFHAASAGPVVSVWLQGTACIPTDHPHSLR